MSSNSCLELAPEKERRPGPLPSFPSIIRLTILQRRDVEWLAAVVSRPDARVSLHHDPVVRVLPQMRDVDVVCRRREVQVVSRIPKLQAVENDDPVGKEGRIPGHVHLAGTERLKAEAIWRTAGNWRQDTRCPGCYLSFKLRGYECVCVHERTILSRQQV